MRELEKMELMRIRDIATCVALGLGVIGRSVSDISQISSLWSEGLRQVSYKFKRKEKISNSLILDKIKIDKIGIRLRRLVIIVSLSTKDGL